TGQTQYILPLYHPAAALYNGSQRVVHLEDFKKIPAILEKIRNGTITPLSNELKHELLKPEKPKQAHLTL
ncbi:MAG: hypothetical protein Q7S09_01860, partial [bacterium]|nr:hypothetical protein [bacterium]